MFSIWFLKSRLLSFALLLLLIDTTRATTLDLSAEDFSSDQVVQLKGPWQLVKRQLLSPDQMLGHPGAELLEFPHGWKQSFGYGRGTATYQLRLKLPAEPVSLYIPQLYAAWSLFVGNELAASSGIPGSKQETLMMIDKYVRLPHKHGEEVTLTLQMSNHRFLDSGPMLPILLSSSASFHKAEYRSEAVQLLMLGGYVFITLYSLILFILHPREKTFLLFGLICLVLGVRFALREKVGLEVLQWLDYDRIRVILWCAAWLIIPLYLSFCRRLFPSIVKQWVTMLCWFFASVSIALTLWVDPFQLSQLRSNLIVLIIVECSLVAWCFTRAAAKHLPGSRFMLLGAILLVGSVSYDIIMLWFGNYHSISHFTLLFWVLIHSVVLGDRSHRAYRAEEQMNMELSQRVSEQTEDLSGRLDQLQAAHEELAQASEAKSNFLSVVSHELRTPLGGIIGTLSILRRSRLDEHQFSQIGLLARSSEKMRLMLDQLLEVARIERDQFKLYKIEFELEQLVDDIVQLLKPEATEKQINVTVDLNCRALILADSLRLQQLMSNLLSNAIKYTHQGEINITATLDPVSHRFMFRVRDTGGGIPEYQLKNIFRPYTRMSQEVLSTSTGLGLSVCRTIVDMMQGELDVTSKVGEGSSFAFTVPVELREDPSELARSDTGQCVAVLSIWLVDDEPINQQLIAFMASELGWSLQSFMHSRDLLKSLAQTDHPPELMLVDIEMPDINGFELLDKLLDWRDQYKVQTRFVAFTANASEEKLKLCRERFDAVLTKPATLEQLQWLGQHRGTEQDCSSPIASNPLERIRLELGESALQRLIGIARKSINQNRHQLLEQLTGSNGSQAEIQRRLHTIASSARTVGLMDLADLALKLETFDELKIQDISPLNPMVDQGLQWLASYQTG